MMKIDDSPTSFLPRDIISAILMRLTFESVLVCKLVSKQWLSIIKDPRFVKLYRDKSMAICVKGERLYRFFFAQDNKLKRYPSCTAESLFQINLKDSDSPKVFSGPSDIVVCLMGPDDIFYCNNLLTGESYVIEDAPPLFHLHCCGFGYDAYGDEYKFLIVCRQQTFNYLSYRCEGIRMDIAEQSKETSVFWVFSFKSYEWKSFNGFSYCARDWRTNHSKSQSFNGLLHWVFYSKDQENDTMFAIVTYDLYTSRFGELTAPNDYNTSQAMVSELDGNLCFLYQSASHEFELWVMKEYGVAKSWTNLFTFCSLGFRRNYFNVFDLAYMAPYKCEDGRQVVLFVCNNDKRLHWYDVTNNKLSYTTWRVKPRKLLRLSMKRKA